MIQDLTLGAVLVLILGQIAMIYVAKKNRRVVLNKIEEAKRLNNELGLKYNLELEEKLKEKIHWIIDQIELIKDNQNMEDSKWTLLLREHQGVFSSKMDRVKEDIKVHLEEQERLRTLQRSDFEEKLKDMSLALMRREEEYKRKLKDIEKLVQKAEIEVQHQIENQFSQWREKQKIERLDQQEMHKNVEAHIEDFGIQMQILTASLFAQGQMFLDDETLSVKSDKVRKIMEPGRIKKVENLSENSYVEYHYSDSGEIYTSNYIADRLVCEVVLDTRGRPVRGTQYSEKGAPIRQFEYDQEGQVVHMSDPESFKTLKKQAG